MTTVKKYRAPDMAEALSQIKAELGSDAIILQSQRTKSGGVLGLFGKPVWEVVAAKDRDLRLPPSREASRPQARPAPAFDGRDSSARTTELKEIHRMILDLQEAMKEIGFQSKQMPPELPEALRILHRVLMRQEVEEREVSALTRAVREELGDQAESSYAGVRDCLKRHIEKRITVTGPLTCKPGECQVLFLVGPTGVGKTTTLVKIAASLVLAEKHHVVLVTTDTFRVAGVAQLQSYADIIGIDLKVAYTPEDLARHVNENQDADFILVDCPGHSQYDTAHLSTLCSFLDAVEQKLVYLTLSCSTKYSDMLEIAKSFDVGNVDGLLITKIDETSTYGSILNLLKETGKPLAYLTNGQNVPYDITTATPGMVAEMVLVARDDS
ncbi:MAG: flagellar biosynthesis protein FlhF [Chloroflexi bacterium]|nr:flagellar biosynthesis protein FlhF [Chloroflexota bacterium]